MKGMNISMTPVARYNVTVKIPEIHLEESFMYDSTSVPLPTIIRTITDRIYTTQHNNDGKETWLLKKDGRILMRVHTDRYDKYFKSTKTYNSFLTKLIKSYIGE